jgi:hypothetical protein
VRSPAHYWRNAARARIRVESSVGSGESASLTSNGNFGTAEYHRIAAAALGLADDVLEVRARGLLEPAVDELIEGQDVVSGAGFNIEYLLLDAFRTQLCRVHRPLQQIARSKNEAPLEAALDCQSRHLLGKVQPG